MSQIGDEILSKVDIVDMVSKYVSLKKAGVNYTGLCPFHNEKTPSFVVSPQKQIFKCFGCGEGGNAVSFHMKIERLDRRDSVKQIANEYHIDIKKYQKLPPEKVQEYQSEKEKLKYINKVSQGFFLENYKKNKEAQDYIQQKRKIPDEIASKFELGYAPDSHYTMLSFLKEKGFKNEDLEKCSLAKKGIQNEYYAFFRNRLTIPIRDGQGKIVAFGARALKKDEMPKYLNTAETILYKKSEILYGMNFIKEGIKKFDYIVIVEGYMDVIAFHTAGFPIAVATCGTALTKGHISILKRYTENVYFLFDNDKAGIEATMRGLKVAYSEGIFPQILSLQNEFKDIDELVSKGLQVTGNKGQVESNKGTGNLQPETFNAISNIIKTSKKGFFWTLEQGMGKYDMQSPVEKQKLYGMMFELIQAINGFSLQQDYLEILADKLNVKYDMLYAQYRQFCKNTPLWQKRTLKQEQTQKKRKTDKMNLLTALMSDNFLDEQNLSENVFLQSLKELYDIVKQDEKGENDENVETDNSVSKNVNNEKSEIAELQLRWEKELGNMTDNEMKIAFIKKTILREINTLVLQHIKLNPNLKKEKKEKIIGLLNKIKTGK